MPSKIGIIGGIGWRSTIDYYAALHELATERAEGSASAPMEVTIESLDFGIAASLLADGERDGRWDGFDNYHRAALLRLERSEVEIAVIACNTPHERLPQIRRGTAIGLVDLFEAVVAEADRHAPERLLVLGTQATMRSGRLRTLLAARGIGMVVPDEKITRKLAQLIADLQDGRAADAPERLIDIAAASGVRAGSGDLVALHCTELPLAFAEPRRAAMFEWQGVRFLNPSMVHVRALLRRAGFGRRAVAHQARTHLARARPLLKLQSGSSDNLRG